MADEKKISVQGVADEELNLGAALRKVDMARWGYDTVRPKTMVHKVSASPDTLAIDAGERAATGPKTSPDSAAGVTTDTQEGYRITGSAGNESTARQEQKQ